MVLHLSSFLFEINVAIKNHPSKARAAAFTVILTTIKLNDSVQILMVQKGALLLTQQCDRRIRTSINHWFSLYQMVKPVTERCGDSELEEVTSSASGALSRIIVIRDIQTRASDDVVPD